VAARRIGRSGAERHRSLARLGLPGLVCLTVVLGCSTLSGPRATPTAGPVPSATRLSEPNPTPRPIPTAKPSPTPLAGLFEPRYAYRFITPWEELPVGEVVIYWDLGDPRRLYYFAWEGVDGDLLEVPGAMGGNWQPVRSQRSGTRIALTQGIITDETETWIDVIDLATANVQGYRVRCPPGEAMGHAVLGPEYLAYGCIRLGVGTVGYYFVPLEAPDQVIARPLPAEFAGTAGDPIPQWLTETQVYMVNDVGLGQEQTGCVVDILAWEPRCIRVPYLLGEVSPDGRWIETRNAEDPIVLPEKPNEVGVLPVSCILSEQATKCEPLWTPIDQDRRELRFGGTWSPDSRSLFLLQGIDCTQKYNGYSSDVWRLEVETSELTRVGTIPNRPLSDEPYLMAAWSPDGTEVLVSEGQSPCLEGVEPWHAFSVATGRLRLLLEDAGIPFAVVEKPQPGD